VKFASVCAKLISYISFVFLTVITLLTVIYKSKIDWMYDTAVIFKNGIIIFSAVIVLLFIIIFWGRLVDKIPEKILLMVCLMFWLILGIFLILSAKIVPSGDDAMCINAALSIKHKTYESLMEGGYLARFPHQTGMVFYDLCFSYISENLIFYEVLNLIWTLLGLFYLWKMMKVVAPERGVARKWAIILSTLFIPQILYIFSIYGVTPGSSWMMIALYNMAAYIKSYKKKNAVGMVITTAAIVLVRQNLLLAVIAASVVLIVFALKDRKLTNLVIVAALILVVVMPGKVIGTAFEKISGYEMTKGSPLSLVAAMGLQEQNVPGNRANGWFNGYSFAVFEECNYDYDAANEVGKREIYDRLGYFAQNPKYAYDFFRIKLISSWCEPTFQSISSGPRTCTASTVNNPVLENLYGNGFLYKAFISTQGIWLIITAIFMWAYYFDKIIVRRQDLGAVDLFVIMLIAGGFVFFFFWEIMSKYIYPFICLYVIPASHGIDIFSQKILDRFKAGKDKEQ